jgi:V/A-type H+-transporting ATPase subunit I
MTRVRVMGPRARLADALTTIQDVGVLHLSATPEYPALHRSILAAAQVRRRRQLARVLQDIDAVLGEAPVGPSGAPGVPACARWARLARRTRRELARLDEKAAGLREEHAMLLRFQDFFAVFESLGLERSARPGFTAFHVLLRSDQREMLPKLVGALEQMLDGACETVARELPGGESALLVLVPVSEAVRVERLLADTRVQDVPPPSGYGGSLVEALPTMRERAAAIPSELEACRAQRTGLLARHAPQLRRAAAVVRDQLAQLDALSYTAVTSNLFVLDGWLPSGTEGRLSRALSGNCGDDVVLETLDRAGWEGEDVPVVLRNPRLFRPFELLTGLLPLPRYGTIDPTPYVAVTFPMFFGLMLGDAGYGAVLALLDLILHRRSRPDTPLRAVAEVTGPCALFAVIFGVLFGEYFGDLGRRWLGLQPLWLDRGEAIVPFLLLTLSIGLVHVVLGLTLGVLASARAHPRQALGRGISAVMILLIVLALLAAVEVLPHAVLTPAVVALLVAFPLLIVLEGVVAAVELLSAIGHILSYARIMALGTASVMLAIVANQLGGAMGSALIGALFALLFHLVNFALGLFSPTIHALRLHYVEFFGTFYSPGGTQYQPLGHCSPTSARTA